jgi:hypothetical protein
MNMMNEPATFVLKQADIGDLFINEAGLECNIGSAFYQTTPKDGTSANVKDKYGELLSDSEFMRAARIIAQPDLYVLNRIGGGSLGLTEIHLHRKKTEGEFVVATEQRLDGTSTIQVYKDYKNFLAWWAEHFSAKIDETVANYIPPKVSLEQFLFILHAIDSFRRVSYHNMLNYSFMESAHQKFSDFTQTMAAAISSADIRWLLPAFMVILPGFETYKIEIIPENAGVLYDYNFLENAKLASGDDVLIFGEAGESMGIEFYRTWLMASGFEINVSESNGFTTTDRIFIAPTAVTNHFVRLETSGNGNTMVNHQAFTIEELNVKLDELFEKAFTMPITSNVTSKDKDNEDSSGWYLYIQQQQYGPYNWLQLKQFAKEGRLQQGCLVWNANMANWTYASNVKGLF